jgi:catechol 2,3-dioxygenase-like lactoylglutathione lyase family enzyme
MTTSLEHLNLTVTDPERTAALLVDLFDWTIRWKGQSLNGRSIHVGGPENGDTYLAIHTTADPPDALTPRGHIGHLNHVGVLVDDFEQAEQRVRAAGFEPYNFGAYEPGRRFYFDDHDGIEFEVISYR